jgi:hypothetical protein
MVGHCLLVDDGFFEFLFLEELDDFAQVLPKVFLGRAVD